MSALAQLDARLIADLGAGLDGPVRPRMRLVTPRTVLDTTLALADRIRSTEALVETTKSEGDAARAELEKQHALALDQARREERLSADGLIRRAQEQASAERLAMKGAHEEALALLHRTYGEEQDDHIRKLGEAERASAVERERADAERARAEEALRRPAPPPPAPPKEPYLYSVEAEPHKDAAGRLRGLTLKSPIQKLGVEIVRDGAGDPILIRINPKGA